MKSENNIRKIIREELQKILKPKLLSNKVYSQKEMVEMGGNYHLAHGMLMMIPVAQIDGLDPEPGGWTDDEGEYHEFSDKEKINLSNAKPIEVHYQDGVYMLYDGNHRVTQAKINGDKFIKAFVQADSKKVYSNWAN